jgi:hypothetical protein
VVTRHEVLELARELRALGVRRVRVGDVELEWGPGRVILPPAFEAPEVPETPDQRLEREMREQAEFEADLFHSST